MTAMMMTAAGTIPPTKVLIVGAGVAGLQAIATAKRLGAVVQAYDIRAAVREQIESLGAKFVQLAIESAEGTGLGLAICREIASLHGGRIGVYCPTGTDLVEFFFDLRQVA